MSKSTLSSVVSSLVRASVGTSVPSSIPDEDLDKHVADLILKEAKQKADDYSKLGIKAYLPSGPDSNAPRTNKRFLSSIIRSTDDHNKTILRAQALAAQEIKREREEQERRERKERAEEAASAERSRRRRRRDGYDSDEWDTRRDSEQSRHHTKSWHSGWREDAHLDESDREKEHRRSRRRHPSRSRPRDRDDTRDRRHRSHRKQEERGAARESRRSERGGRKHDRHESRDEERRHKRRRHSTRSPDPERSRAISRKRSHSASLSDDQVTRRKRPARECAPRKISTPSRSSQTPEDEMVGIENESHRVSKGKKRNVDNVSPSASPPRVRSLSPPPPPPPRRPRGRPTSSTSVRSPSISPPPLPPAALPSKMDKYFEDTYDPRLDAAPLFIPTVPKTGLINNSEYEAWDAMLELLRQRREDKEEKKRLEKLGFNTSDKKIPTSKLNRYGEGGDSIMDIEYKKKGSVREWDLGKEGL